MASDRTQGGDALVDPRDAAVAFVTTEHFTLEGARSQTISESTGRASIFLASVSGGLVALGLVATAAHVGTAFYVFGHQKVAWMRTGAPAETLDGSAMQQE